MVAALLLPLRRSARARSRLSGQANLVVATDISEFAANMQEVRVFGVETPIRTQVAERIRFTSKLQEKAQFVVEIAPALYQGHALLLVVGAVGLVYASGVSQLSALGGIVLVMVRSVSYGQQLQSNYQNLQAAAPFLRCFWWKRSATGLPGRGETASPSRRSERSRSSTCGTSTNRPAGAS